METLAQAIGRRVRLTREKKGWSMSELARALGKKRQSIYALEQGIHEPRAQLLLDLSLTLGVTAGYLLGLTEDPHEELEPAAVA